MVHQGGSGGNMARPSTPSGHLTPSFPTPATIGAQPIQALFQENQCVASIGARAPQLGHPSAADTLQVAPAVAAQTFYYLQPENHQPHRTMPRAGVPNAMPLQHFTLPPQPFQPNNYAHGWAQSQAQAQLLQQQARPRYAALQPVETGGDSGNPLPPPPQDAHILQHPMMAMAPNNHSAAPLVAAYGGYGATSWANPMLPPSDWPVQQPAGGAGGAGGQASSWAWAPPLQQRPGMPAASASAQTQPPPVTGSKKTFEEFLLEAGVLDQQTLDINFLDEFADEMLGGDEQAKLGPVERDDRLVSLGDVLLSLGLGPGSSSGAGPSTSRHQVRLPAQQPQEALGTGATGGYGRDQAAAAEARERRSRRMAKQKEAAARPRHHRPDKHAAPRGSQNGTGAI